MNNAPNASRTGFAGARMVGLNCGHLFLPALPMESERRRSHSGCPDPTCPTCRQKALGNRRSKAAHYGISSTSTACSFCGNRRLHCLKTSSRVFIAKTSCDTGGLAYSRIPTRLTINYISLRPPSGANLDDLSERLSEKVHFARNSFVDHLNAIICDPHGETGEIDRGPSALDRSFANLCLKARLGALPRLRP